MKALFQMVQNNLEQARTEHASDVEFQHWLKTDYAPIAGGWQY
jgi:hypothetical protein